MTTEKFFRSPRSLYKITDYILNEKAPAKVLGVLFYLIYGSMAQISRNRDSR